MNAARSPKFLSAFSLSLLFGTTAGTGTRPVAEGTASSPRAASSKNTFVFLNGRFLSEGCGPYGFGDALYQAFVDGGAIRFHAETHSPTHGTMVWNGIVQGDTIEATNTWTRKRWYWNIKKEYWYKGRLQK